MINDFIPTEVWSEVVLELLDARDLMAAVRALGSAATAPGARFVAKRILAPAELDWFAAQGVLSVDLLVERREGTSIVFWPSSHWPPPKFIADCYCCDSDFFPFSLPGGHYTVWTLNGEPHREGDLPAIEWDDTGDRIWCVRGKLHRAGGLPAVVIRAADGVTMQHGWFDRGRLHRDDNDLPAIDHVGAGCSEWWVEGQRHRENDRPAVVLRFHDGSSSRYDCIEYWVRGQRHRENDQPASQFDGRLEWYVHGVRHRENGRPAVEDEDGNHEWWIHGKQFVPVPDEHDDNEEEDSSDNEGGL